MGNTFYEGKKFVSSPEHLPPGEHYVILTFGTITIPGDERSRNGIRERLTPFGIEPELTKAALKAHQGWKHDAPKAYVMDLAFSQPPSATRPIPTLVEINCVLTSGGLGVLYNPSTLVTLAWDSYTRYAERGEF